MAAMPSARDTAGLIAATGRPATDKVPESAGTAPVITLMSVDFPAPFSPTSAWTSPSWRSNDTPDNARTPAYDLVMRLAERSGGAVTDERLPAADGRGVRRRASKASARAWTAT